MSCGSRPLRPGHRFCQHEALLEILHVIIAISLVRRIRQSSAREGLAKAKLLD